MDDKWAMCGRFYRRSLEQLQAVARRRSEMLEIVESYELRILRGRLKCWLATHKAQKVGNLVLAHSFSVIYAFVHSLTSN